MQDNTVSCNLDVQPVSRNFSDDVGPKTDGNSIRDIPILISLKLYSSIGDRMSYKTDFVHYTLHIFDIYILIARAHTHKQTYNKCVSRRAFASICAIVHIPDDDTSSTCGAPTK